MRNKTVEAIILKNKDFGEADKLLTLYTRETGRQTVKAKGARKIMSKLAGHLDTISLVKIDLAVGRAMDTVTGAQIITSFKGIKKDLQKISLAIYFLELTDRLFYESEGNQNIFEDLVESLNVLERLTETKDLYLLKTIFESKILSCLGHKPVVHACVICNGTNRNGVTFDFHHGGAVCEDCKEGNTESEEITEEALRVLNAMDKLSIGEVMNVKNITKNINEVSSILKSFNEYIYNKHYKAESFWKKSLKLT